MQLSTVEIDFEIHKAIEAERRGFDEPPYFALRRLLKLTEVAVQNSTVESARPWREGAVEVPHGSDARMSYLRGSQFYEGKFLNGSLVVDGKSFSTLSSAASALAKTKDGSHPSLNGWNYWEVRFPGETRWRRMQELRSGGKRRVI